MLPGTLYSHGEKENQMSISKFPDFKNIDLSDQDEIENILNTNQIEAAEFTFPNLFAWREYDRSKLTLINDNLCILSTLYKSGVCCFVQPVGGNNVVGTINICLDNLVQQKVKDPRVLRVSKNYLNEHKLTEHFKCDLDRDNSDYVYLVSDLAELKGRKYDGKRNHIKKVRERGNYEYCSLTPEYIPGCNKVLSVWSKNKFLNEDISNLESLIFGEKAIKEYLKHFEILKLFGGVILRDGIVVAFTIASRLNKDTAVTYAETSLPNEPGLNQLLNQEFCQKGLKEFKYVNREQDLGHEGLRKAKMSYHPDHLVNKYIIRVKK